MSALRSQYLGMLVYDAGQLTISMGNSAPFHGMAQGRCDFLPKDNRGILKNQVELPEELTLQLVSLPEAGMGYHVVDLILKNDRILTGRKVLNCKYLILHPDESVDTNEIEDIVI